MDEQNLELESVVVPQSTGKMIEEKEGHWFLEYIKRLLVLAVFGILGLLARYGLRKLFGPDVIGLTNDESVLYPDLPSNMVGSFFMGWFGVVFRADVPDLLAFGLTTGFLGSLTTFSGWNQSMLDLSAKGQWIFAVLGFFGGFPSVAFSIIFGIETAKGLKWLHKRFHRRSNTTSFCGITTRQRACLSNKYQWTFMVMLLIMLVLSWCIFGILAKKNLETHSSEALLFIAVIVETFGVWIRWHLARFNGRGLGKNGMLEWMPWGTLAANVLAICIMAALATVKKVVKTKNCDTVASGIQLGLPGNLSTVSTFIAEFHAMRESEHPWRAYVYASVTIMISFVLGTLIYSVPVWVMDDD